jgi:hypothetical protein
MRIFAHREHPAYAGAMKRTLLLGMLVACKATDPGGYPDQPGGPGGPGHLGGHVDAAIDGTTIDGTTSGLAGRVCLVADPRALTTCATTGAGDLTVTVGGHTATTAADGTFSITPPIGSGLVWQITGAAIAPSVMPVGLVAQIPAISQARYAQLLADNGVILTGDQGSLFARLVHGGAPATGVTVAITPTGTSLPFYDGASATAWNQNLTGAAGVAWVPGDGQGTITLTTTPATGAAVVTAALPIQAGAITFVTVELP